MLCTRNSCCLHTFASCRMSSKYTSMSGVELCAALSELDRWTVEELSHICIVCDMQADSLMEVTASTVNATIAILPNPQPAPITLVNIAAFLRRQQLLASSAASTSSASSSSSTNASSFKRPQREPAPRRGSGAMVNSSEKRKKKMKRKVNWRSRSKEAQSVPLELVLQLQLWKGKCPV